MDNFSNIATLIDFSPEAVEMMRALSGPYTPLRSQLIVSPEVKARIDADPQLQKEVSYITGSCFDPPQQR